MPHEINFLIVKRKEKVKGKRSVLMVRIVAICYLVLIGFLSILAFYFTSRISLDTAKKSEDSFFKTLTPLKGREAKLLFIRDRIANISEILRRSEEVAGKERVKKANYEKLVNSFKAKIPQGVMINALNVDESKVVLNLSSDSLNLMDDVISGLTSLGQDAIISSLLLESLSLNKDKGTYSILLTATL